MAHGKRLPDEEEPRTSAHTRDGLTADGESGDRDPEVEAKAPPIRRNLDEAADEVADLDEGGEHSD